MQNNPNLPLSLWLWRQHISVYSCKLISFRWISNVSSNYIQPDLFINWHPGRCSSASHAYGAAANASSALNVDELHQEISVRSLILIIP